MSGSGIPHGFTAEWKFLVDATVGARIADWARQRLAADPHGAGPHSDEYRVSSLYLDTAALDVFHRRGSYGRSKYRIRRYEQEPTVYLERKLRNGTRLAKRRSGIELPLLPLLTDPLALNGDGSAWFRRRVALRRLRPVCHITYLRLARDSQTADGPARLTLDRMLAGVATDALSFDSQTGTPLLDGDVVVELKFRGTVPALFKQLVEEFTLTPSPCSKYRTAVAALGLVDSTGNAATRTLHA